MSTRILLAIAFLLSGCGPMVYNEGGAGVAAAGGAATTAVRPANPPPQNLAPAPVITASPVPTVTPNIEESQIDDPEQQVEEVMLDKITAYYQEDADRKCRDLAAKNGLKFSRAVKFPGPNYGYYCYGFTNHPEPEIDTRRRADEFNR